MQPGTPTPSRLLHLRAVAQRVSDVFADHPAVSAILVVGSVAHGVVDARSDVDLLIACRPDIPSVADRTALLGAIGTGWKFDQPYEGSPFGVGDEDGKVAGVFVTIHYQTVSWIDTVLRAVLEDGAITSDQMPFRPYTLPALLQRAWVLLDRDGDVARWHETSSTYPSVLQRNILHHAVPELREHVDELNRTAERGLDSRTFIHFLNAAVDDLTSILFALNGVYDPADRRMHTTVIPFLPYLPDNYVATMIEVLEGPFNRQGALRSAQLFKRLATETLRTAGSFLGEFVPDGERNGCRARSNA